MQNIKCHNRDYEPYFQNPDWIDYNAQGFKEKTRMKFKQNILSKNFLVNKLCHFVNQEDNVETL